MLPAIAIVPAGTLREARRSCVSGPEERDRSGPSRELPATLRYTCRMPPLLEAKGLTKRYGATIALESVDLQIHEGVTGLLGPHGAGKSTAIKPFLGLITPTAGSVEVMGQEPHESEEGRGLL